MTIAEWIAVTLLGPSILGILGWLFSARMVERNEAALRDKEFAVLAATIAYLKEDTKSDDEHLRHEIDYLRQRMNGLLKE